MDPARVKKLASLDGQPVVLDALERGEVTQNQAFALARLRNDELAADVVAAVTGLSDETTAEVARRVRALDHVGDSAERVQEAITEVVGTPVVGRRTPVRRDTFPLRTGGATTSIEVEMVDLTATPLRQLLRRREADPRDDRAGPADDVQTARHLATAPSCPGLSWRSDSRWTSGSTMSFPPPSLR
jgi:hypothetical protein